MLTDSTFHINNNDITHTSNDIIITMKYILEEKVTFKEWHDVNCWLKANIHYYPR